MNFTEGFDYVVVGSGAGGGPVAANLALAGFSVLLLEAGGDYQGISSQVPAFHPNSCEDSEMAWDFYVKHYSDPSRQRCDSKYVPKQEGILYPRASTLGGCTAHNAMVTIVPHDEDWDGIAALTGDKSWNSEAMWSFFQRLEDCRYLLKPGTYPADPLRALVLWICRRIGLAGLQNPSRHGFGGWLATSMADPGLGITDAQLLRTIRAAIKTANPNRLLNLLNLVRNRTLARAAFYGETAVAGLMSSLDTNDRRMARQNPEGLVLAPVAVLDGSRSGPREYVRRVAALPNSRLTVRTHALVSRVLLDAENRAVGVEYLEGAHLYKASPKATDSADAGVPRSVRAAREVILAGGAFNTPQLLMLSGIGPKEQLQKWNIPVRVDLPGVGRNLQDRYEVTVVSQMMEEFSVLREATFTVPARGEAPDGVLQQWLAKKAGLYTSNGVVLAILRRSRPELVAPDLCIFGLPGMFKGYYPGFSADAMKDKSLFTWAILKAHTRNTAGAVTLRSANPRDVPEIEFHYFDEGNDSTGQDLQAVVEAVQFVRRISKTARLITRREEVPGDAFSSEEELRQFIQREAWGHHASCTCKIGAKDDPMAVLDSKFRVRNTKSLRVVDASVFPSIPGVFIVTAIYMIAEKASDDLLADAKVDR